MPRSQNQVVDVLMELKDAGLIASSAAATVGAAAQVIDVGAEIVGWNEPMGAGEELGPTFQANVIVDVSALEIASNDESYDIVVQGSNTAAFATATDIVEIASLHLGAKEIKRTDCDRDDVIGRYMFPMNNIHNGVAYRYLRVYTVVAGTVATGINYTARFAQPVGP